MSKGRLIGRGRTAEVYEWGQENNKVLKLYFDWYKREWIEYESKINRAVYEAKVLCPAVYEDVEDCGRKGIVFERIDGKTMLKLIEAAPWKAKHYGREMAGVHSSIHSISAEGLPEQKDRLKYAIKKSAELLGEKTEDILRYLEGLQSNNKVCHGDFHPDNIIMSSKAPVTIDWNNASSGNPLGDVARTSLMLKSQYMPEGISKVVVLVSKHIRKSILSAYLKEYCKLNHVTTEEIDAWILPTAAARLQEKVPGEKEWLLGIIDSYFKKYGL